MQWWEVQPYIDGSNDRTKDVWLSQRIQTFLLSRMLCKDIRCDSLEDFMPLPWDKTPEAESEADQEAALRLIEQCKAANAKVNPKA